MYLRSNFYTLTVMPIKRPRVVKRGEEFFCPVTGCGWKCTNSHSYSRHYDGKHTPSFKFMCKWGCGAGQDRSDLAKEHAGSCWRSREANLLRRGTKPRYATPRQARKANPADPEEAVQEIEETLEVVERENKQMEVQLEEVERENEQLKADKVKLEESLKESEWENGQLNADKVMLEESLERVEREKEEMRTYVVKLEVQLKERVGHGQENALGEEDGQGEDGEPGVEVSMEPELVVLGADMECEPLMEDESLMVLQGDKETVLGADMECEPLMEDVLQPVLKEDNMEFVLEVDNMRLVLEDEEDVPLIDVGGDQPPSVSSPPVSDQPTLMRSTMESQGPGMVEHQLVDKMLVLEAGGKVLNVSRRKSTRRTGAILRMEKDAAIEARLRSNVDSDLLQVVEIEGKGRAVQTLQPISKADYVAEYAGDLIDAGVAKDKEEEYAMDLSKGCYLFYFLVGSKKYCVDATAESGRLGRLLNHSMLHPNCGTKVAMVDGRPRLYFVAKQEIPVGSELVFDYGDRSKASFLANPWLAL